MENYLLALALIGALVYAGVLVMVFKLTRAITPDSTSCSDVRIPAYNPAEE